MHFSSLADSLAGSKNPLYLLHDEIRQAGNTVLDLVRGNVNEHGIVFPPDTLNEILTEAAARARVYRPDSFGQEVTREAISRYYNGAVSPSQVLVTPGTSVSYWYCFKLLAEPGDEILTPQPAYPLFDYIARLCDVNLTYYRLDESRAWSIDLEHLEEQISAKTRAIVLISPHNPTGMVAGEDDLQELAGIANRYEIPIISDEVFSEFLYGRDHLPRPLSTDASLVFTMNGFSKMFALPGMKIGWLTVSGDENLRDRALAALELISDTFLPVNEIAQFAAPQIFSRGQEFLRQYKSWVTECRNVAVESLAGCDFAQPGGGFYITLPLKEDEEAAAGLLLQNSHILVHPGYFYDIAPNHLVTTFIEDAAKLRQAFSAIAELCRG